MTGDSLAALSPLVCTWQGLVIGPLVWECHPSLREANSTWRGDNLPKAVGLGPWIWCLASSVPGASPGLGHLLPSCPLLETQPYCGQGLRPFPQPFPPACLLQLHSWIRSYSLGHSLQVWTPAHSHKVRTHRHRVWEVQQLPLIPSAGSHVQCGARSQDHLKSVNCRHEATVLKWGRQTPTPRPQVL
jgi:hypothetical protein